MALYFGKSSMADFSVDSVMYILVPLTLSMNSPYSMPILLLSFPLISNTNLIHLGLMAFQQVELGTRVALLVLSHCFVLAALDQCFLHMFFMGLMLVFLDCCCCCFFLNSFPYSYSLSIPTFVDFSPKSWFILVQSLLQVLFSSGQLHHRGLIFHLCLERVC